jgi:hemoglobin-like flavoprotein
VVHDQNTGDSNRGADHGAAWPERPGYVRRGQLKQLIPRAAGADIALQQGATTVPSSTPAVDSVRGQSDGVGAMTPQQMQLVKDSFAKVVAIKAEAAALFYHRLFELDPSLRPLFKSDIAARGAKLMAALGGVVASLDRLDDVLPVVRKARPPARGLRRPARPLRDRWRRLIWTLEQSLGPDFPRETRRAWTDAYVHLAWAMVAAAEDDETVGQAA